MAALVAPALDPSTVPELRGSSYPEPYASQMGDRVRRKLGEALGLTGFGVNLVTLAPGAKSALRHWHTHEDELIYVLSGELMLISDEGEQRLGPGMAAGFPAGKPNAHHLVNKSGAPAQYLEIGDRQGTDQCHYPDDDLMWLETSTGDLAAHKDGTLY
jgi:uncharacterized cupin superfamily protein